uniref:Uncharacterized protein n=1 Tax=Eutreptiella gymnastica TaxID=73025 RepID=A0A7S4GD47_9EUGL
MTGFPYSLNNCTECEHIPLRNGTTGQQGRFTEGAGGHRVDPPPCEQCKANKTAVVYVNMGYRQAENMEASPWSHPKHQNTTSSCFGKGDVRGRGAIKAE